MENQLLIGDPIDTTRSLASDSIDLAWLDARLPFGIDQAYDAFQLPLFDPASKDNVRLHGVRSWSEILEPIAEALCRVLRPTGRFVILSRPDLCHHIRATLDKSFGPQAFEAQLTVTDNTQRLSVSAFALPAVLIIYLRTRSDIPEVRNLGALGARDKLYRHIDKQTGRSYALADCVHPTSSKPELKYDWNGITRVWRWTLQEMEQLHASGRLVHTRSGMPRVKRYLDEVTPRRSRAIPAHPYAIATSRSPTGAHDTFAGRILDTGNVGDAVLDVNARSTAFIAAAQMRGRRWTGIAANHQVAWHIRNELRMQLGSPVDAMYVVTHPRNVTEAKELARVQPAEFKAWALGALGAFTPEKLRHTEAGIDARLWLEGIAAPAAVIVKPRGITAQDLFEAERLIMARRAPFVVVVGTTLMNSARGNRLRRNVATLSVQDVLTDDRALLLRRLRGLIESPRRRTARLPGTQNVGSSIRAKHYR